MTKSNLDRRSFLRGSATLGAISLGSSFSTIASSNPWININSLSSIGPLQGPDENGIRLPQGFTSHIVAVSGQPVSLADGSKSKYLWHSEPDGGAVFPTPSGGWIYTSNSELARIGGAGALRFDENGKLEDAYPILRNTNRNCAGGPTPWGTWLSCEESDFGKVYECDVNGNGSRPVSGLGYFKHEAVAIDPIAFQAYLTEDTEDGLFYRYTPSDVEDGVMNLDDGILEAAHVDSNGQVYWKEIRNPNPSYGEEETRYQTRDVTRFNGGEGIWYHDGDVYFTTKGDNRVWRYNIETQTIGINYDRKTSKNPILSGVDNVTVSSDGHVLVAEDGGDLQIVVLGPFGDVYPLLQLTGQDGSEITGPAITPAGDRLYFSSQRGGFEGKGITYEIRGKFS